jgi:hypothetical protein
VEIDRLHGLVKAQTAAMQVFSSALPVLRA